MKKHLLIVDDEKDIIDILTAAFKAEDTIIGTAGNGEEAVTYIKNNHVDIVIADIMMPKLNGIQMFYEIRKLDPFIQIIMITGYPSIQRIVEMLEAGACDFVIKPFNIEKLKVIVQEAFTRIERWKSLRGEWLELMKHKKI